MKIELKEQKELLVFEFFTNAQNWQCGIIHNFVFPYLFLQHMTLVNVKLDINECNRITFQGYKPHWSSSFLMAQLKRSWHY